MSGVTDYLIAGVNKSELAGTILRLVQHTTQELPIPKHHLDKITLTST